MIGLQEMQRRMDKPDHKAAGKQVVEMLNRGYYDHDEVNMFGKGWLQREQRTTPVARDDATAIMESVRGMPLKEFLASSGTAGIAGAAYLIPTKIYSTMYDSAVEADVVAAISIAVIPAEQIGGTTMNVDIAVDESYAPRKAQSGAKMPDDTIETVQATLDFSHYFGINFRIGNDLIEDAQFDVIEMHLRNAGREMGEFASNEALTVLRTGTDGDGTIGSSATGDAASTKYEGGTTSDIIEGVRDVVADGFVPDTMAISHEAMLDQVMYTVGTTGNESSIWDEFAHGQWPQKMAGMDIVYSDVNILTTNKLFTNCQTVIFDKDYALLSGRKRWLRIENYSEPVRDLTGATITARQDSVSVYNDSIYRLTET